MLHKISKLSISLRWFKMQWLLELSTCWWSILLIHPFTLCTCSCSTSWGITCFCDDAPGRTVFINKLWLFNFYLLADSSCSKALMNLTEKVDQETDMVFVIIQFDALGSSDVFSCLSLFPLSSALWNNLIKMQLDIGKKHPFRTHVWHTFTLTKQKSDSAFQ